MRGDDFGILMGLWRDLGGFGRLFLTFYIKCAIMEVWGDNFGGEI